MHCALLVFSWGLFLSFRCIPFHYNYWMLKNKKFLNHNVKKIIKDLLFQSIYVLVAHNLQRLLSGRSQLHFLLVSSSGKLPMLIASTKSLMFSLMLAMKALVEHILGSFTLSLCLLLLLLKFSVLIARKHSYVSRVLNCQNQAQIR